MNLLPIYASTTANKQMTTWNSTVADEITFGEGFGGISSLNVGLMVICMLFHLLTV